jgi:hypothetical protein
LEEISQKIFWRSLDTKHVRKRLRTYCRTVPHGEQKKSYPTTSCLPMYGLDTEQSAEEMSGFPLLG